MCNLMSWLCFQNSLVQARNCSFGEMGCVGESTCQTRIPLEQLSIILEECSPSSFVLRLIVSRWLNQMFGWWVHTVWWRKLQTMIVANMMQAPFHHVLQYQVCCTSDIVGMFSGTHLTWAILSNQGKWVGLTPPVLPKPCTIARWPPWSTAVDASATAWSSELLSEPSRLSTSRGGLNFKKTLTGLLCLEKFKGERGGWQTACRGTVHFIPTNSFALDLEKSSQRPKWGGLSNQTICCGICFG